MSAKNALKITTKLFKINLFRGVKVSKSLKLTSILEDCRKLFNLLKFNISNKQITMADEFFYGVTLKGAKAHVLWNPESTSGAEEYPRANKLIVKQILLGVEAKSDEYNVVEVETKSEDSIVKIPIAVLKVGENRCSQSFLEFPDAPIKFTLIQGEGPVHIHGHHLIGDIDTDEIEEEIDEEEFDDGEEDQEEPKNKKAKVASQNSKGAKNDKNSKKK
ncbi:hypothetical protein ACKWTF_012264 [Chironomus riparius]